MSYNTLSDENKVFVSKLYGLKSGLSLISIEADKVREAEDKLKNLDDDIANHIYNIEKQKKSVTGARLSLEGARVADKLVQKKKKRAIIDAVLAGLLALGSIFCAILGFVISMSAGDMSAMPMTLIACVFMFLGSCAFLIYQLTKGLKVPGADHAKEELERWTDYETKQVKHLDTLEKELVQLKNDKPTVTADCNKTIKESTEKAMLLYRSLHDTYGDDLMEEDWQNIDYIIYVYVTGRADTLQAALKCLDDERRYLGIVNAIDKASNEISNTLNLAFMTLGNQISEQFASLERNINRNTMTLATAISDVGSTVKENTNAVKDANNSIAFQNALQKKSNENTKKLADDMSYVVNKVRMGSN